MVLFHRPEDDPGGQVARDRAPGTAVVVALEEVGRVVALLVVVGHDEDGRGVVLGRLDVVHEGALGDAGEGGRPAPARAAVPGHLDQAVVGAGDQDVLVQRRFGDGRNGGVNGHRGVAVQCVHAADPPGHRELVAVVVAGQVAADGAPRVAAVVASPHALGGVVDPALGVGARHDRRVPVPALGRVVEGR